MHVSNPRKSRALYIDLLHDHNYTVLEKIAHQVIVKFLESGVITEADLGHVIFNRDTQMY